MPTPLVLSLDLGTSSARSALFDITGQRQSGTTAQQSYTLFTSAEGGAEIEPGALLGAVRKCIAETLAKRRTDSLLRTRPVGAIAVSSFWHSLVGCNAKGEAITRIITWADSRCRDSERGACTGCVYSRRLVGSLVLPPDSVGRTVVRLRSTLRSFDPLGVGVAR